MAMFTIITAILISVSFADMPIGIITSDKTSDKTLQKVHEEIQGISTTVRNRLNAPFDIQTFIYHTSLRQELIPQIFLDNHVKIIIDVANDAVYCQTLAFDCEDRDILHIVFDRLLDTSIGEEVNSNSLYFTPSYRTQALAFVDLIKKFKWENLALIYDENERNIEMAYEFKHVYDSENTHLLDELYIDSTDPSIVNSLSARLESTTKDSGARVILVFTNSVLAARLLRAGDEAVMGGSGFAWLISSSAMKDLGMISRLSHADEPKETFGVLQTGSLGLVEETWQYHSQDPMIEFTEVITLATQFYISEFFPVIKASSISGAAALTYFTGNHEISSLPYAISFESGVRQNSYKITNIVDFVEIQVGSWNSIDRVVEIPDGVITWPGFSRENPNDKIPVVTIGLIFPNTTADGEEFLQGVHIKNSFQLALNEINDNPDLLGEYQLAHVTVDSRMSSDYASVALKSIKSANWLGYIGAFNNTVTQAYLDELEKNLDPKPLVSYASTSSVLSTPDIYTTFSRVIQPDSLQAVPLSLLVDQNKWKKIAVIYTDNAYGNGIYESFVTNVQGLDIEIANDEGKRKIRADENMIEVPSETKDDINEALSEIVIEQLKIIVFLGDRPTGVEVFKVGYEKELYGEDYAWISAMPLKDIIEYVNAYYSEDKDDIMNVLNGAQSLGFSNIDEGKVGQAFQENYKKTYDEDHTIYGMYTYDAVYMYAHAIDSMLQKGDDLNNGKELSDALRASDFLGASGQVQISESSNDRNAIGYDVYNIQNEVAINVAHYDPTDPNLFNYTGLPEIKFGDGVSSAPDYEWDEEFDCPFAEHMVKQSQKGLTIICSIGAFLFVLTIGLSWFSYRKWRQVNIHQITEPVTRSWQDTVVQLTIGIEFFQFVAIAPQLLALQIVVRIASNLFLMDIVKMAGSDKSQYWTLLIVICVICYIWFLCVLAIMLNAETWMGRCPFIQRMFGLFNSMYLPFFGNTMFLPFATLLLDPYVCDFKAQGKPYVWRDCYMNCWTDDHFPYVIISALAITCYLPIAVFSRPLWQQAKTGLNIMAKPLFLLVKTCVQILLIVVGKSLQGANPLAHGVVFSILMAVFIYMTIKIKPFNYGRFNVWEIASLIAILYIALLASISNMFNPEAIGWFIGLILGWAIIFGVAYFIQRKFFENLLVPPGIGQTKRAIGQSFMALSMMANKPADNKIAPTEVLAGGRRVDRSLAPSGSPISYSSSSDGSPSVSVSPSESVSASRAEILSPELQSSFQNEPVQNQIVDEIAVSSSSHSSSKEDSEESGYDIEEHIEEENKTSEVVET